MSVKLPKATGGSPRKVGRSPAKSPQKPTMLPPLAKMRLGGSSSRGASTQLARYKEYLKGRERQSLLLGDSMTKKIKATNPEILKKIKGESERIGSGSDQRRAEKRQREKVLQVWLDNKKARLREEKRLKKAAEAEISELKHAKGHSQYDNDVAFSTWKDRKRKEDEQQRQDREDDVLHCPNGLHLDEVLRAFKAVAAEIDPQAQTICKDLIKEMARTNEKFPGYIDPEDCELMWSHSRMHFKLVTKVAELQKQQVAEQNKSTMSFLEDQQQKLVTFILQTLKSSVDGTTLQKKQGGRTFLGTAVHSVKQFFDAIDKDHSGTIDQDEFGVLCQRIDLGLNEKQVAELWGAFDDDDDGVVTFTEFEDTLVTAEARRILGPVPKPILKIQYAIALQELLGEDKMYDLFVDLFMKAMRNRVNKVMLTDGIIGLWEFQTLLKELETPELNLLERREFLDIYGRKVFRKFATRNEHGVFAKIEDILYFSRKLLHRVTEHGTGRHAAKTQNALDFRVGKKIIKNFGNSARFMQGKPEDTIIEHSTMVFKKIATPVGKKEVITRHTMQLLCQELGFFLSAGEIDNVFTQIDDDSNGFIDLEEWTVFIESTQKVLAEGRQRAADAADPRNDQHLVHLIVTNVSSKIDIMSPIISRLQQLFASDKPKPEKLSRKSKQQQRRDEIRATYSTYEGGTAPAISED